MEYETRPKIDPNRSEKVFTASQVMMAFQKAELGIITDMTSEGAPITAILSTKALSILLQRCLEVELGIDGIDGAYVDGKAQEKRRR